MTDDLRNRIASVLSGYVDPSHRYDLADAVIRELALREDRFGLIRRWVSDWEPTGE